MTETVNELTIDPQFERQLKERLWKEFMERVEIDDHLPEGVKTQSFLGSVARYRKLFMG